MKKYFLFFSLLTILLIFSGCEREGMINTDDCREIIQLKDGSLGTFLKSFTCEYEKTDKGDLMWGQCSSVKMNKDTCQTAWTYEKSATKDCGKNAYLSRNGECYCNPKLVFNKNTKKCEQEIIETKNESLDLQTKRIAYYEYLGTGNIKIIEVDKDYKTIKNINSPENSFVRGNDFVISWNDNKDFLNVQCPAGLNIISCEIEDYKFKDNIYTDPSALIEKDDFKFCFMNGKFLKYGKLKLECDK